MDTPDLTATVPPEQHAALFDELGALVNQAGGVSGLVQQFESKGLGGLISGWISNGPNPPISGQQVQQTFGLEQILAIAGKLGLTQAQVTNGISTMLPKLIDGMTPQGSAPEHSPDAYAGALNLLKSEFFGH